MYIKTETRYFQAGFLLQRHFSHNEDGILLQRPFPHCGKNDKIRVMEKYDSAKFLI